MTMVKHLESSVQKIAQQARLNPTEAQLVRDCVIGITARGEVMLTEIARATATEEQFMPKVRWLSKHLGRDKSRLDQIPLAQAQVAAPITRTLPFVIVDSTDLVKRFGHVFEDLAWVRDASSPGKDILPGYWSVLLDASDGKHRHIPLYADVFSTESLEYKKLGADAWRKTFLKAVDLIVSYTNPVAWWLFDRGFDDCEWHKALAERKRKYVIRTKCNRNVILGNESVQNIKDLASGLKKKSPVRIPYVDKKTHQECFTTLYFTWVPIRFEEVSHPLYLIVVTGTQDEDWYLVTNICPRNAKEAAKIILAFVRRWGEEEVIRAYKQLTHVENFRVQTLLRIRRIVRLAWLALFLLALWVFTEPALVSTALKRAKVVIKKVLFCLYRLWRGVAESLPRSP